MFDISKDIQSSAKETIAHVSSMAEEAWMQTKRNPGEVGVAALSLAEKVIAEVKEHPKEVGLAAVAIVGTAAAAYITRGAALKFGKGLVGAGERFADNSRQFSLLTRTLDGEAEVHSYNALNKAGRVVENSLQSTVQLRILQTTGSPDLGYSGTLIEAGSGVIIRDDGIVATCGHNLWTKYPDTPVVSRILQARVHDSDDWRNASVLVKDPVRELALLSIEKGRTAENFNAAKMSFGSAKIQSGTEVFAIGHPIPDSQLALSPGRFRTIERQPGNDGFPGEDMGRPLMRFDANIDFGNSGGGLFVTENGSLLGIVGKGDKRFGAAWAYPAADIQELLSTVPTSA